MSLDRFSRPTVRWFSETFTPVSETPLGRELVAAGFAVGYKGVTLERGT